METYLCCGDCILNCKLKPRREESWKSGERFSCSPSSARHTGGHLKHFVWHSVRSIPVQNVRDYVAYVAYSTIVYLLTNKCNRDWTLLAHKWEIPLIVVCNVEVSIVPFTTIWKASLPMVSWDTSHNHHSRVVRVAVVDSTRKVIEWSSNVDGVIFPLDHTKYSTN